MHAQTYSNSMCLSATLYVSVKFNNCARKMLKVIALLIYLTLCVVRHSHDVTMSIIFLSQNSFFAVVVGRNSIQINKVQGSKRLRFVLHFQITRVKETDIKFRCRVGRFVSTIHIAIIVYSSLYICVNLHGFEWWTWWCFFFFIKDTHFVLALFLARFSLIAYNFDPILCVGYKIYYSTERRYNLALHLSSD